MSNTKKKAAGKRRRSAKESGAPNLVSLMKCALCALPITAAVGMLLLFISTALMLLLSDPNRYRVPVGLCLLLLTAFLGGMIATRLYRRRSPLLCGFAEAALLLLLLSAVTLFLPDGWHKSTAAGTGVLFRLLLLPASLCGAFVAARTRSKRKRKR